MVSTGNDATVPWEASSKLSSSKTAIASSNEPAAQTDGSFLAVHVFLAAPCTTSFMPKCTARLPMIFEPRLLPRLCASDNREKAGNAP